MNAHVDNAGFEQLSASWGEHLCDIYYNDLDAPSKVIYDDAMGIIVADCICQIDNTPYELSIDRLTSSAINENVPGSEPQETDNITKTVIDYTTLSAPDQAKLDAFNQLLIDKCW
jgi:hypothetical protein